MHLDRLTQKQKERYDSRARELLCVTCGKEHGFWGLQCILCRSKFRQSLLPIAARKAIRSYLDAERQRELEHARADARFVARKLLLTGEIAGRSAEAVRLYAGTDDGIWRTYEAVGKRLGVSRETVRLWVTPVRDALLAALGNLTPAEREQALTRKADISEKKKHTYLTRKAKGLCCYGSCPNEPVPGHTRCPDHLRRMLEYALETRSQRINEGICIECGARPGFWGRRCILCRVVRTIRCPTELETP